ncbi:hypothetical protein PRK78_005087 [Emydomyces testavorans]|uniref:Protein kinase domain-containing protein n=1 Tax=Emydomyces testavorans TaxID=2070801 RepID=A0AAF0DJ22_9EURO|nr:hypothetical protein PRK78_005087 [Emydomyces testavorans]
MAAEVAPFRGPLVAAILRPSNTAAKVAFHLVAAASLTQKSHGYEGFMHINSEQQYDEEVARALLGRWHDHESDSATDPTSSTEAYLSSTMAAWTAITPSTWALPLATRGSGTHEDGSETDFILTTPGESTVRVKHARFNFNPTTGFLCVNKRRRSSILTVNSHVVDVSPFAFNHGRVNISIGHLGYVFEYTDFAYDSAYPPARLQYFREHLRVEEPPPVYLETTPLKEGNITVGQWTIHSFLGAGGFGRVCAATNAKSQVVAMKNLIRNLNQSVDNIENEVKVLRELTELAESSGHSGRLLLLRDVIYHFGNNANQSTILENAWLVMEPVVQHTFTRLMPNLSDSATRTTRTALFREALLGVNFLHSHGWIHADLKPENIGVRRRDPPQVVLLDLGSAIKIPSSGMV